MYLDKPTYMSTTHRIEIFLSDECLVDVRHRSFDAVDDARVVSESEKIFAALTSDEYCTIKHAFKNFSNASREYYWTELIGFFLGNWSDFNMERVRWNA